MLAVIYLVFTEGYVATSGEDLMRPDLAREAIRLARLLDVLMPGRGEIKGLLALMLLYDLRAPAARPRAATSCCWKSRTERCGTAGRYWRACSRRRGAADARTAAILCGAGGDRCAACACGEL